MRKLYPNVNVLHQDQSSDQLFTLLQNKDITTLAFLYDKYAPALYGAILRQVGNQLIASEVLQKTFIKIWQAGTTECITQSIFTWMYSIANLTARAEITKAQHPKNNIAEWAA